jgi:hypothetical protein
MRSLRGHRQPNSTPHAAARANAVLCFAHRAGADERGAQDDATLLAIRDMERAGIDIITDGEIRRESRRQGPERPGHHSAHHVRLHKWPR